MGRPLLQQSLVDSEDRESLMTEDELNGTSPTYTGLDNQSFGLLASDSEVEGQGEGTVEKRMVDVVLSDMSAPWEQTTGFHKKSLSDPYYRMMNTSGMAFRDHAGSMVRFQPQSQ